MDSLIGNIWGLLAAIIALISGAGLIFLRGWSAAKNREARRRMEERVHASETRANEERHVDRSGDPAGELRRDWKRGV